MIDDLDTLRPEIREAVAAIDKGNGVFVNGDDCDGGIAWATARAELLRLAEENAQLRDVLADRDMDREMAAHANKELAALKARIADGRTTDVFESEGHAGMVAMGGLPCEWIGKNVRMLVED